MRRFINRTFIIIINILIIITSGTVWQVKTNIFEKILSAILLIFIFINIKSLIKNLNYIFVCVLPLLIYMTLGIYVYDNVYFKIVIKIILISIYFIICNLKENDLIIKSFSRIILLYSLFNIIIYLLLQFNIIQFDNSIYLNDYERSINKAYLTYKNIFFNWQGNFNLFGINILRNSGIFVEAGRYGVFLSFALIIELLLKDKISKINVFILLISVVTTVSTTTIIIAIFLILIKYIIFSGKKLNIVLIFVMPIAIISSIIFSIIVFKDKLKSTSGIASLFLRAYDIKMAFQYFKEKFFFGWGIGNDRVIKSCTYYGTTVDGNANGITKLLYQGGLFFSIFYIMLFVLLFNFLKNKLGKFRAITIITIFIFQIASQGIIYDSITIFILIFGYINFWKLNKLKNKTE